MGRGSGRRAGGGGGGRDRRRDERRPEKREAAKPEKREAPRSEKRRERPSRGDAPQIAIGATANQPELVETIAIGGGRAVALSLGPDTKSDAPLPDLAPGDRLLVFAELELTTDAEDEAHPGRIGNAYSYAPDAEASLLLAPDPSAADTSAGAIEIATPWRQSITHQRHHAVVTFADAEFRVPPKGLPWGGGACVNLAVGAASSKARPGDVLLVGQNEKVPKVVQDMAGIRVVRFRPGDAGEPAPIRTAGCLCAGVPVAKQQTVVLSQELADLAVGEQLLVRGRLVTDAGALPAPARISTRMFIADSPDQTEPGGGASASVTWKGHLSKFTGFNCVPGEGPQASSKFGVAAVRATPGRSLYVNMVAVSAAPFGGIDPGAELPIDTAASSLAVTRFAP